MGLEKEAKKARRRYVFDQAILTALKLGVIMSLAIFAPNAMRIIKMLGWLPSKRNPTYTLESAVERLERRKLIHQVNLSGKKSFKITDKGRSFLWKLESKYLILKKPNKWDKRWRLIIFDIKEVDRFHRDAVRVMLQNIGCVKLQNSVWAYPYECEEVVTLLKANYKIGEELLYIIAEKVEGDEWMKKYFKIK